MRMNKIRNINPKSKPMKAKGAIMYKVIKSYFFCLPNPFSGYFLDLNGIGHLEISEGVLTSVLRTYDMAITTSPRCRSSIIQKIFGLGDVSFNVTDGQTTHSINLKNIRNHKYIAALCCKHHLKMSNFIFENTNYYSQYNRP